MSTYPSTADVLGFYVALDVDLPDRAGNVPTRCFLPDHDDGRASASINTATGAWYCHACGQGGGPYDAAIGVGKDKRDAAELCKRQGLWRGDDEPAPFGGHGRSPAPARQPAPLPSEADLRGWHGRLLGDRRVVERLGELRGWSRAALEHFGLGFDGERVVIPARGRDGQLLTVLRYRPGEREGGDKKMLAPAGRGRELFPPPEAVDGDAVWLVEGEPDAIAAHELHLPAVAIPGTGYAGCVEKWAPRFAGRRVVISMDDDAAGRKAAERIAPVLAGHATDVRVLSLEALNEQWREGYDLTDVLLDARANGGVADARRVLLRAAEGTKPYEVAHENAAGEPRDAATDPGTPPGGSAETVDVRWPEPLGEKAFHGLAGEVVRLIEPHSEADPAALLIQLLVAFGNACGRGPGFQVEGDFHATNLYVVLVGATAKGRKGTSWGRVSQLMALANPDWTAKRVIGGLASGEGLIYQVRDPETKTVAIKEGRPPRTTGAYEEEVVDAGVEDKRLLVMEGEFARVLKVMQRDGNTLSPIIRDLWDRGSARTLTKNQPGATTGALVSIVAHVTRDELGRELSATESANGFANRFLFVCVKRSKQLPFGGQLTDDDLAPLADELRLSLRAASVVGVLSLDASARELWGVVYPDLSEGAPGLVGAVTGRAEAQVMRLAVLYALLDRGDAIALEHLEAALALWRYCAESACHAFGGQVGHPLADRLLALIREKGSEGLARSEFRDAIGGSTPGMKVDVARDALLRARLIRVEKESTGGRASERFYAREQREQREQRPSPDPLSYLSYQGAPAGTGGR